MADIREQPYPTRAYAWFTLAVLLLAYSVAFVDRQILSLMVAPIRSDLGLSDTGVSLLHGFAFAIFYTFAGIYLGRWADRHNRQKMIIVGVIVWCIATALCGFARNFTELFMARILVGVGEATLSPAAYSIIADSFTKERRGRATSVYAMGMFAGSGLALIFGGAAVRAVSQTDTVAFPVLGAIAPWRAAFIVLGLSGLLIVFLLLAMREPSRKGLRIVTAGGGQFWRFIGVNRGVLATVIMANALMALVNYSLVAWLPTYFIRIHSWTPAQIATAYGLVLLTAGCAGMLVGGYVSDRQVIGGRPDGAFRTVRAAAMFTVPLVAPVSLVQSPIVAIAMLVLATFALGVAAGPLPASLNAIVPNEFRGRTVAVFLFVANFLGLGIGPTLVALLTDYVFGDDLAVGRALAIVTAGASLCTVAILWRGGEAYARAIGAVDAAELVAGSGQDLAFRRSPL